MQALVLKKGEDRRLRGGHLWVFSNEVDTQKTPLKSCQAGEVLSLQSSGGDFLGYVYVNPNSLICARICSRDPKELIDREWLRDRIKRALQLRTQFYTQPYYRLVHGEGDLLPGLVIDRYNDILVVQINTAGMERLSADLLEVLKAELQPSSILLRNDSPVRDLENLPRSVSVAFGEMPDSTTVVENGLTFCTQLQSGQKTGWFYDHRENRAMLQRLSHGKSVLDVYAYLGAWGMNAAAGGAREVLALDASQVACELMQENASLNNFSDRFSVLCGDAVASMRKLQADGRRFDILILDPPAFIKRKKDYHAGKRQYELINKLALQLLASDGLLVSASCSQHLSLDDLKLAVKQAAKKQQRECQLLWTGSQAPDHPIHFAIPENNYLKMLMYRAR